MNGRKLGGVEIPLILFALFIDFFLDPVLDLMSGFFLGGIADAIAAFTFTKWLEQYGVELYGEKNATWSKVVTVLEFLPTSILPLWTLRIVMLIIRDASGREV